MIKYNINDPKEIRVIGMQALMDVLGPVGTAKFIQQYDTGHGDYTKEKYDIPDMTFEEVNSLLKYGKN